MLKSYSRGLVAGAALVLSQMAGATTLNAAYFNVFNLGEGGPGDYQFGDVWGSLELAPAIQIGTTVALAPNTSLCGDNIGGDGEAYWCTEGKWVEMLTYEQTEVPAGDFSRATFTGCFTNDELPAATTVSAFVKILGTDYSLYAEDFQSSACWDISFDILGDVPVIVQKGFQVWGPNADPRDGDPGSVTALMGITELTQNSQFDPNAIPALPLGGLFGLIGLVAWLGLRRKV